MSDEQSNAIILAKLEQLAANDREASIAQGRLLQEVSGVRSEVSGVRVEMLALSERVGRVEATAHRAERTANEAKQRAEGSVTETSRVHDAWKVNAEALRMQVERVQNETSAQSAAIASIKAETHAQTVDLKRLVAAETEQAMHRKWQRDQVDAVDAKREKRRKAITWALATVLAVCSLLAMIYGGVQGLRALLGH